PTRRSSASYRGSPPCPKESRGTNRSSSAANSWSATTSKPSATNCRRNENPSPCAGCRVPLALPVSGPIRTQTPAKPVAHVVLLHFLLEQPIFQDDLGDVRGAEQDGAAG